MAKKINIHKIYRFENMRESMSLEEVIKESNRCLLCHDAPCSQGCPAGTDPGKFIRQIKFENYKGAARTIRNNNILGSVCAHLCPVEKLCEKECSINALEHPIDIAGLQRFACDYGQKNNLEPIEKMGNKKEKIAIIGAGPSGLSCAFELAKIGYHITIFEKETAPGGIARWNIPDYRLPQETMTADLSCLENLSITFQYESSITSPDKLNELLSSNFKAVFIGIGLGQPTELPLFQHYTNVMNYFDFLYDVKTNQKENKVKNRSVIVLGGGSVSMDAACTAAAMSAKKVTVIYRRSKNEMPADHEEIQLADQLNVNFKTNSILTEVMADKNKIIAVKGTEIEWKNKNESMPINNSEFSLNADLIIQAIGTKPDDALLKNLKRTKKGTIEINDRYQTSLAGVFSAGDVANGGTTIAQAVGEGKKAAKSINEFINAGETS